MFITCGMRGSIFAYDTFNSFQGMIDKCLDILDTANGRKKIKNFLKTGIT
jgi:hypothetical protein